MDRSQNTVVLSSGPALSLGLFSILAIQATSPSRPLHINQTGKQNQAKTKDSASLFTLQGQFQTDTVIPPTQYA